MLRHRRGPLVTNLSTSLVVEAAAREAGVEVVRAPVGEVNVAVRMREVGAAIGGEGNGGVILPEVHLGRDAPIGAALLLQLLLEERRPLSAIVDALPRYVIVKDKLPSRTPAWTRCMGRWNRRSAMPRPTVRTGCGWPGRTGGCTCDRRVPSRSSA